MPVFLLFEMFYFQQFLTYQVCGLLSRLPVKSSTLWWNQQYEQVLNIGEISCDLMEISYLCGRINNYSILQLLEAYVVICSKFPTFVVESTTGNWRIYGPDEQIKAIDGNNGLFSKAIKNPLSGVIPPALLGIYYYNYDK